MIMHKIKIQIDLKLYLDTLYYFKCNSDRVLFKYGKAFVTWRSIIGFIVLST